VEKHRTAERTTYDNMAHAVYLKLQTQTSNM